ncbi:MAG TPA: prolyl oligopeptidase family serine peptidase [Jiangellaceae bacterium]|nr:prolyl oligopeptidase family serine peptidase [Jiangellaceae bacterium]
MVATRRPGQIRTVGVAALTMLAATIVTVPYLAPSSTASATSTPDPSEAPEAPPGDGVVSPDGERIAWISDDAKSVWSATREDSTSSDWGSPERLLTIRGTVAELTFSPDSQQIAFENPRDGHGFIAVFDIPEEDISFVDPAFATDTDPEWSADGTEISFVRQVEGIADEELIRPVQPGPDDPPDEERTTPFSLESVLAAPFVSELTRSGDGQGVAYVAREATERNIYFLRPGERTRNVVSYAGDDGQELSQLATSENGNALAYVRGGEPNDEGEVPNPQSLPTPPDRQVWITATQGAHSPHLLGTGAQPQISPDGERVIWVSDQSVMSAPLTWARGQLRSVGEPTEMFTFEGSLSNLRFSPDGTRLTYERESAIEVYELDTDTTSTIPSDGAEHADPSWSPDGDQIAFRQEASGEPFSIHVADVPSLEVDDVWQADTGTGSSFYGLDQDEQLLWSADDRIAFPWEGDGWRHLYAVPVSGGDPTLLTPGEGEVETAAVSTDGSELTYTTNIEDQARRHLWTAGFDGSTPTQLTDGDASQWAPTPLADGMLAYIDAGWSDPTRVTVRDDDGQTNAAAFPRVPGSFPADHLVKPEVVEFTASDGEPVNGELFLPEDSAGQDCAIVFPHGGPGRQMLPGFHYMETYTNLYELNQYFASQGCVLLSVEYRGGTMYGHDFRNAPETGRQGASEYRDVLGAAEYLSDRADVDPDRLGIYGLSWGGYIAALGLARDSETFSVGFDMAGVHEFYGDAAPYAAAADIDTWTSPVYLAHADDDRAVDFSQGRILAELLQSERPDVELEQHVFPDEIHDMYLTFDHLNSVYRGGAEFMLDRLQPQD